MDNVLITGGAGFIGFHLAKHLTANGCRVVIADNFSRGINDFELDKLIKSGNASIESIDLLKPEQLMSLGQFDYIFHFAAIIGVRHVEEKPFEVLEKNMLMLSNIIAFCKEQRHLRRLIFTSTSEVYAGTIKYFSIELPTPENTPLTVSDMSMNRTSYMLSKIYGEAMCIHSGVPFTIVRPHNIYGPRMGMSHVVPELMKKAFLAGDSIDVLSPEHTRSFCYIDDAVIMLEQIMKEQKCENEIYNLGNQSGEITIRDLAGYICKIVNDKLTLNLCGEVPGSPSRRAPAMGKLESAIGSIRYTPIEKGLNKTFEWYKMYVFAGNEASAL